MIVFIGRPAAVQEATTTGYSVTVTQGRLAGEGVFLAALGTNIVNHGKVAVHTRHAGMCGSTTTGNIQLA